MRISSLFFAAYSRLSSWNERISSSSRVKARTTRRPARFSCTRDEICPNCSWIFSKREWMRLPNTHTVTDTSDSGMIESIVSRGLIASMNPMDTIATVTVLTRYMMPGPTSMRTAERSLMARDRISPVRVCW